MNHCNTTHTPIPTSLKLIPLFHSHLHLDLQVSSSFSDPNLVYGILISPPCRPSWFDHSHYNYWPILTAAYWWNREFESRWWHVRVCPSFVFVVCRVDSSLLRQTALSFRDILGGVCVQSCVSWKSRQRGSLRTSRAVAPRQKKKLCLLTKK